MQDVLSSRPAACRKGEQLCIAQGDRLPQWVSKLTNLEDKYAVWGGVNHSQGDVFFQPGSRGQARAASLVEKEVYRVLGVICFFLYTVVWHVLWFGVILWEFFSAWSLWLHLCSSRHWLDLVTQWWWELPLSIKSAPCYLGHTLGP